MFSSISKATPQTQRTTGFIASRAMTISPVTPFTITVNGLTPSNPTSISVNSGDTVTAVITTPDDWLWYEFYQYEIDGVPSSFAVVNKSNYTISVKPDDAAKRWYMYEPATHTGTYKSEGGTNYPINFGSNYELIPSDFHVLLNPLDDGVYFFDINGVQVSKINLPADPIDYVKIPNRQSVVVLVRSGEAYEIFLNNTTFGIAPFYARLNYSEFTDNNFIFQLPGEDLITYLRRARAKTAIPPATSLAYDGMFLFAGGNGSIWVVDPDADFNLVNEFEIDEFVINITALPNNTGIVFVTQSQKVYKMDYEGNFTELHQGTALWQPAFFNGRVYIPEGQIGLLKVYNPVTNSFEADILLDDFSPSHITIDSNKMYVAGHDTERVLVFDTAMNITEKTFPDKVTLVSAVNGTLVASHWMKSFKVLNLNDLRRIVSVEFLPRRGPISHIGTSAVTVKTLGNDEVFARTPAGTWLWINGQRAYTEDVRGSLLLDGDIISINRACRVAGLQRTNCIIGDVVYDYDVEAVTQSYYPRHIDLPILPPGEFGIHTRTITLPRAFTPCLMSIEYGVVKVNGAYYYGDTNVTAGDIVSIEIETANNSILPVFTVGARQFVVPVSSAPTYDPVLYTQNNVNPLTTITEEIIFTELGSLFDYIIPGYYDATIKKNDVDITGNYFQQFGVGDKLVVTYTSSPKLYDTTDIYILGPTNYKFTAQNTLGNPIDFLDYGNLLYPYTRQLDPYAPSASSYYVSDWYGNAVEYITPEIQYITANIVISGVPDSIENANISISGGDSYFVLDGSLQSTVNIKVFNGSNLALARNVLSYFDGNIQVTQHLPTGDDDGWADVIVGNWGLVNRDIIEITTPEQKDTEIVNDGSVGTYNIGKNIKINDANVEFSRTIQRTINSSKEQLELDYLVTNSTGIIEIDKSHLLATDSPNEELDYPEPLVATQSTHELFAPNTKNILASVQNLDQQRVTSVAASKQEREVKVSRNINASVMLFDKHLVRVEPGYKQRIVQSSQVKNLAYRSEFIESKEIIKPGYKLEWQEQVNQTLGQNSIQRLTANFRLGLSYLGVRDLPKFLVFFDLFGRNNQDANPLTSDPYKIVRHEDNVEIIDASRVDWTETKYVGDNTSIVGTLDTNTNQISTKSSTVSMNNFASVSAEATLVQAQGSPSFMANYVSVSRSEVNSWIDKDTTWQTTNFFTTPMTGAPVVVAGADYYLVTNIVVDKISLEVSDWDRLLMQKQNIEYTDVKPSLPKIEISTSTLSKSPPTLLTIDSSGLNLIDMIPDLVDNQNYLEVDLIAGLEKGSDTAAGQSFVKIDINDTLAETPIDRYSTGLPALVKSAADKFAPGRGDLVDSVAEKAGFSDTAVKLNFRSFQLAGQPFVSTLWNKQEPVNLTFDRIPADANPLNLIPARTNPDTEPLSSTTSKISAISEGLRPYYFLGKVHQKENSIRGTSAKQQAAKGSLGIQVLSSMPAETASQQMGIYIKPAWAMYDYGIEPFVVYRLEHEQQKNIDPTKKIALERERPQFYFTAITVPELNQGIVWDQDISVEYGAFTTENDAFLAAASYTEFRTQLILDTNLWTYRVLFDTGLVCPLPSGRYAVAWLIRGG